MIIQRRKYRLLSDEELVLAYATKPSQDILHVLYERYGHLVLGLCIKYMKQVQNAEDLCSTIFEKLPSLLLKHEIRYFKSWLYQVSRNECLMVLRKKNPKITDLEQTKIADEGNLGLEEKREQEVEIERMESALTKLKSDQKQCISLFYLEEKSYQEISIALSMSIKAVKSHIQNGKRKLKIVMEAKP